MNKNGGKSAEKAYRDDYRTSGSGRRRRRGRRVADARLISDLGKGILQESLDIINCKNKTQKWLGDVMLIECLQDHLEAVIRRV